MAELLIDRASMLTLSVPEMTVLVGGMRALNANAGQSAHGVFTDRPGTLSNDFFVNLLEMSISWTKSSTAEGIYEGRDRATGKVKWTGPLLIWRSGRTPSCAPWRRSMLRPTEDRSSCRTL